MFSEVFFLFVRFCQGCDSQLNGNLTATRHAPVLHAEVEKIMQLPYKAIPRQRIPPGNFMNVPCNANGNSLEFSLHLTRMFFLVDESLDGSIT